MPTGYTSTLHDGEQTFPEFALACALVALYQSRSEPYLRSWALVCGLIGTLAAVIAYTPWQEAISYLVLALVALTVVMGCIAAVAHDEVRWELRKWLDYRRFDRKSKRLARSDRKAAQR